MCFINFINFLFAGGAIYMGEGDTLVREQLENMKHQVRHWSKMYSLGLAVMPILVAVGTVGSIVAYCKTK